MGKITLILGIILTAMIFEKNPLLGMAILGICIFVKFLKKEQNETHELIKSQEKNSIDIYLALKEGFDKIRKAIIAAKLKKLEAQIYQNINDEPNN